MSPKSEKKLYLLDGHSLVYKAFHAMGSLSNKEGFPTGAIYGFLQIFFRLIEREKPHYLAVVFDPPGPSFRKDLFDAYKANRPEQPEEIREQFPVLKEILEELKIPMVVRDKYEADDVIGSLAKWAEENGDGAMIVSVDKDLYQCVTDKVTILRDHLGKIELIDIPMVKEKMGVTPQQVPAYLGLLGDTSDNIPGVPGVGKKRASDLLNEFGDIPTLLKEAEGKTKPKFWANLDEYSDQAKLSEELATIKTDMVFDENWDDFQWQMPEASDRYRELLQELNFRSLLDQLGGKTVKERTTDYKTILKLDELKSVVTAIEKSGRAAIDTETTSLDPYTAELVGISISWKKDQAVYIPLMGSDEVAMLPLEQVRDKLSPILSSPEITWIAQNWGFDYRILKQQGFEVRDIQFDTMIAAYLINPDRKSIGLKSLSMECLNIQMTEIKELVSKQDDFFAMSTVPLEDISSYACQDADITFQLAELFEKELAELNLKDLFDEIEMPLVTVLAEMELKGVSIDQDYFRDLTKRTKDLLAKLKIEIHEIAGKSFNINSPKQLAEIFFNELDLPVIKKTATGPSTDVSVLEALSDRHPLPAKILVYRQLEKLRGTYIESLPILVNTKTGRLHTSFNQTIAATGRLSSSDPNLQNIPIRTKEGREIRQGFVPSKKDWKFLAADYSQIELRILAHISKDPALIDAFSHDQDIHTLTASKIFKIGLDEVSKEQRGQAKAVNFGIIYGMSAFRLSNDLKIGRDVAKQFIDDYFDAYKGVRNYIDSTIAFCNEHRYVETLMGRKRFINDINSKNYNIRSQAERIAMNTPVQGTCADMIKKAMIDIHQALADSNLSARMLLQVHDELIFEAPESELEELEQMVTKLMVDALPMDVPVIVETNTGENWAAIK